MQNVQSGLSSNGVASAVGSGVSLCPADGEGEGTAAADGEGKALCAAVRRLDELEATVALGNNEEILAALHKLVPTYRRPEEVNKNAEQVNAQCAKAKCCSVGVAI